MLKNITECLDGLGHFQIFDKKMISGENIFCRNIVGSSFNSLNMSSSAMKLELESAAAALHYYGENYIKDEGLRKEFNRLIDVFYAHNTEMMKDYRSAEESFDLARKKFGIYGGWGNTETAQISRYLAGITHNEEEEAQYKSEISALFDQVKQPSLDWTGIWKQIQNSFLNYVTKGSDKEGVRRRALEESGGIFTRMENMWSDLLRKERPVTVNIQA